MIHVESIGEYKFSKDFLKFWWLLKHKPPVIYHDPMKHPSYLHMGTLRSVGGQWFHVMDKFFKNGWMFIDPDLMFDPNRYELKKIDCKKDDWHSIISENISSIRSSMIYFNAAAEQYSSI